MIVVHFGCCGDGLSTDGVTASRTGATIGTGTTVSSPGEAVDGSIASRMVGAVTDSTVAEAGGTCDVRPIGVGRCSGKSWTTGAIEGASGKVASVV